MQSQTNLNNNDDNSLLKFDNKEFIYTWRIKDFQDYYNDMPDRKNDYYIFSERFSSPGPHITQSNFDPQSFIYKWRLRLRIHGYQLKITEDNQEINYKYEIIRSHPDNRIIFQQENEMEIYEQKSSEKSLGEIINIFPDQNINSRTDLRIRVYIKIIEKKSHMKPPPKLLLPHFIDYFDNGYFSDINFTFDCGSNIKASKIILASRSEYFKTMFNGKWKESKESKIYIKDTKYKIFRHLLKYIYTNELDEGLNLDELKDLYIESDLRNLEELRKMVAISIGEIMNVENWEQVLKFGYEIDNEGIKYSATLFGINNWEEICAKKQHKELTLDNILSLKLILLNFENTGNHKIVSYGLPRVLTIVFGVLFILFVLNSIFGITGILFKSPGGIKLYAYILWGAVIIYIGLIAIVVTNIIRSKQEAIDLCIKQAGKEGTQNVGESAKNTNNNIKEDCNNREVAKILINSIVLILSTLFTMSLAIKSYRYSNILYRARIKKIVL
ncbi:21347_t:CDS:2 [Rhizophagus irregularis]|nr:21347_t:CDS:2 [Rhizophagus irregularis]